MIRGVSKILISVDNQEKAKEFWVEKMGFDLAYDAAYGDERWIEVRPPDGSPVLVLLPRSEDEPRPDVREELPHSNVFFTCDDIEKTFEELRASGVRFPAPPTRQHFGWWSMFEDDEGTRYALSPTPRDPAG